MTVVAASVTDVVASVGGLLFDRRSAGWDVTVLLTENVNLRPLAILGVGVLQAAEEMDWAEQFNVAAVALALNHFTTDDDIKTRVLKVAKSGLTEVTMWGNGSPLGVKTPIQAVVYRMSGAALAFKDCALRAAGSTAASRGVAEGLICVGPHPEYSDLTAIERGGIEP